MQVIEDFFSYWAFSGPQNWNFFFKMKLMFLIHLTIPNLIYIFGTCLCGQVVHFVDDLCVRAGSWQRFWALWDSKGKWSIFGEIGLVFLKTRSIGVVSSRMLFDGQVNQKSWGGVENWGFWVWENQIKRVKKDLP